MVRIALRPGMNFTVRFSYWSASLLVTRNFFSSGNLFKAHPEQLSIRPLMSPARVATGSRRRERTAAKTERILVRIFWLLCCVGPLLQGLVLKVLKCCSFSAYNGDRTNGIGTGTAIAKRGEILPVLVHVCTLHQCICFQTLLSCIFWLFSPRSIVHSRSLPLSEHEQ